MPDGAERTSQRGDEPLQIGEWLVEPALNQLSGAGGTVKLEPKAMALLCHLAERPGQVVSREALLSAIWPGVVVGDDSLTQAVIKLRKALGDVAESPAYIQTIPKRGYRLVAKVATPAAAPAAPDGASAAEGGSASFVPALASAPSDRTDKGRRNRWLAAATAVVVATVAASVWWNDHAVDDVERATAKTTTEAEGVRAAQPTISVRAFDALDDDAEAKVLARGVTADLITDLLKVSGLSVIGDGTSPGSTSPGETSRETATGRYVVSGSVQRAGERLRLNVYLSDAQNGKKLWSERFDRTLSDVFTVQEELGRKILQIVPAKVSEAELRRVAKRHTRDLQAYEYFQRGQMAVLARHRLENETAREMFKRAIELDPSFAAAYSGLAQTYLADHRNQWTPDGLAALERAYELARTAHEINPDIRETYFVLALVHLERRQYKQALEELETAVRLYPSYADAYAFMGGIKVYTGDPATALGLLRTAMRLNPDAGYLYFLILGRAYFGLGDLEQARLNLEHALLRNPTNVEARVYMAATHVATGNKQAAAWEADEIRTIEPRFSIRSWLTTHPLTDTKTRAKLASALAKLGFE